MIRTIKAHASGKRPPKPAAHRAPHDHTQGEPHPAPVPQQCTGCGEYRWRPSGGAECTTCELARKGGKGGKRPTGGAR